MRVFWNIFTWYHFLKYHLKLNIKIVWQWWQPDGKTLCHIVAKTQKGMYKQFPIMRFALENEHVPEQIIFQYAGVAYKYVHGIIYKIDYD